MTSLRLPVVYVAGSSHSGSTLLALLGSQHPGVASVGEASIKPRIRREGRALTQRCSCGLEIAACPFWQAIFRRVATRGLRLDAGHWSNDYRFEQPLLDRIFTRETSSVALRRARRWAARSLPIYRTRIRHVDTVNVAFVGAVLEETGASVFLDTTKLLTRLTHLLDNPAFDVRVVWLTRDVRGVAYSARKRGLSVEGATAVWRRDQDAVRAVVEALPPGRSLHVRYEDLCASPPSALAAVWTFCGLEPIEVAGVVRPADHHVLGNSMRITDELRVRLDEAWRTGLSDDEQRHILSLAGPVAATLGYR